VNAQLIYDYLTRPMVWVTACFGCIFTSTLLGYKTGGISLANTLVTTTASVIGYAAAHFAQYRIGRSLKMTQDAANRS
jgi:hypothetical protein